MSKYLEYFNGAFDNSIVEKVKPENRPYVAYSKEDSRVIYTTISKPVVYDPYVTFTAQEDYSSIGLTKLSTNQTMEYSTDTTTWNKFDTSTDISLKNNGDKVYVRGILSADNSSSNYTQFWISGKIAASGSCNALWNYEDLDAPLKEYCGRQMFQDCESLTTAPELPATTLISRCYYHMFDGCTSLTTAPELPATELADWCYGYMFKNCTSLITAPELPATELADGCYDSMFQDCTSLTTAPELPATTLTDECYYDMFENCTSLTTAPELPATTLADNCCYGMFRNCTSLTTAPSILPATTLAADCYEHMFDGCTSLTIAPELPATTLADYCYAYMFCNCTSLTTAPELPATTLASECYYYMFSDCTKLNYIKCLATDISDDWSCTTNWVQNVPTTGTFVKHPNATWSTGVNGKPSGWTTENAVL